VVILNGTRNLKKDSERLLTQEKLIYRIDKTALKEPFLTYQKEDDYD